MKYKQKATIFLVNSITDLDGSIDLSDSGAETFDKLESAIDEAKEVTQEYGLRTYVYKCVPVVRIDRGRLRVTNI